MTTEVRSEPRLDPAGEVGPPADGVERSPRVMLMVGLSAAAGIIHAKAFIDHVDHYWLFGVFFAVLTYAQVLWAMQLYRRPDERRLFGPVAVLSLGVVAVWLVSRTVGLPIGPWAGRAEPVGVADFAASLNEILLAAMIFAILRPARRFAARLAWLDGANCVRIGSMLCALSLMALLFGSHSHAG